MLGRDKPIKKHSISRRLTVGLMVTVLVVSAIAMSFSYLSVSQRARAQLEDSADEYIISLTDILEIPLWNLTEETIRHIGLSYAHNDYIVALRITDNWGRVYFESEREQNNPVISRASEIFHEDTLVGTVELSLDSDVYAEVGRQLLLTGTLTVFVNLLSLIIMTGFLLRRFLRIPLEHLGRVVDSYALGRYDSTENDVPYTELQPLVTVLGEMGRKITAQIGELTEYHQHLEKLVEQRTEELAQRNAALEQEIVERKKVEDALRISEQEKAGVLDSMSELVVYHDLDLRIMWVNKTARESFGVPSEELVGCYCYEMWHQRDEPCVDCTIVKARDTGQPQRSEYVASNKTEWVIYGYPVKGADGEVVAIVEIIQDVTELKRAEQEHLELMQERQRIEVLQRFISDASHDLRTPLSSINASLYILKMLTAPTNKLTPQKTDEKRQQHLTILGEQHAHLQRLIEDLLTMSRLDMDVELMFEQLDLNTLIGGALTAQSALAASKKHKVEFTPVDKLPSIKGDGAYLSRALEIIILNALHYTSEGGMIIVRAYEREQQTFIEVQDNGMGVSAVDLPRVFERFYRGDEARNTHTGGTGLGLAIARKIIELHNGNIEVESEEGKGSTFRIVLPVDDTGTEERAAGSPLRVNDL